METKTALITGANTGIGKEVALSFARKGIKVFIASRSYERTIPVIQAIEKQHGEGRCKWLHLDLESIESIHRCTDSFFKNKFILDYLVNNAGFAGLRGLTKEGFELAFGVNYFGHYGLTRRLEQALIRSKSARIINVSSKVHSIVKKLDFASLRKPTKSLSGIDEYAVSKLAIILFTSELHRRYRGLGISSFVVHPGLVNTEIWRTLPFFLRPILKLKGMLTPEEGARNVMQCAWVGTTAHSGKYFSKCLPSSPSTLASDRELAIKLWEQSESWMNHYSKIVPKN